MAERTRPIARRHHTVPMLYLRGFAQDDELTTVNLSDGRSFPQSVNNASIAKDFYSLPSCEGDEDAVEAALSEIEGEVAGVLSRITDGVWPLPPDDRETLVKFVALQYTRVPARRRLEAELSREVHRKLSRMGVPEVVLALASEASAGREDMHLQQAQRMLHMFELAEQIAPFLIGRPWTLVRLEGASLITSDSPVGLIPRPGQQGFYFGTGFATAWGVTFPLTRKLGLVMDDPGLLTEGGHVLDGVPEGAFDQVLEVSADFADDVNRCTANSASQWLFHHPDDGRYVPSPLPSGATIGAQAGR